MRRVRFALLLAVMSSFALLTACGGGSSGGGTTPPPNTQSSDWGTLVWGQGHLGKLIMGDRPMRTVNSTCGRCARTRLTSLAAFVGLMLLLVTPTATGGQVGALVQFTNGTVADANEVNQNFGAIRTAVNDNDARITALEGASGGQDLYNFNDAVRTGIITVPGAGGTADIRPPMGEVWIVDAIGGNAGTNIIVGYSTVRRPRS